VISRRKISIYLVFIISVTYGVYFHFIQNHKPSANKHEPKPIENSVAEPIKIPQNHVKTFEIPPSWGINPFQPERLDKVETDNVNYSASDGLPSLTGISFYHNDLSYAIIDNEIVQSGDKINDWLIIAINKNFVQIKNEFGIKILRMENKP
jgi:hypothetical protein